VRAGTNDSRAIVPRKSATGHASHTDGGTHNPVRPEVDAAMARRRGRRGLLPKVSAPGRVLIPFLSPENKGLPTPELTGLPLPDRDIETWVVDLGVVPTALLASVRSRPSLLGPIARPLHARFRRGYLTQQAWSLSALCVGVISSCRGASVSNLLRPQSPQQLESTSPFRQTTPANRSCGTTPIGQVERFLVRPIFWWGKDRDASRPLTHPVIMGAETTALRSKFLG